METVKCPICKEIMKIDEQLLCSIKVSSSGKYPPATKYEDCIRKCFDCKVGASNGKNKYSFIYECYKNNIPEEFHVNLGNTLDNCLNIKHREDKKRKIGFSTSEDAVSWIFIRYFIQENKLELLKEVLSLDSKILEIFMWGVPQLGYFNNNNLKRICEGLEEDKGCFSEPDIIIECEKEVVFIEVKVESENKHEKDLSKYDKYLDDRFYKNKEGAKNSRCYELIRNWTISHRYCCLSDKTYKTAKLINLAPNSTFMNNNEKNASKLFIESLNRPGIFIQLSWEDVIDKLDRIKDENLIKELEKRIPLDQKLFNQK